MEKEKKICRYENEITNWKCPYEALEDSKEGFCIFHERTKDKDINEFNEGIKKILEDKESDAYHFEGFFFPSSIDFSNFEFKKDVFFTEAEFTGKLTNFSMARFSGEDVDVGMAEFSGENADFMNTRFSAKTIIFGEAKSRFCGVPVLSLRQTATPPKCNQEAPPRIKTMCLCPNGQARRNK